MTNNPARMSCYRFTGTGSVKPDSISSGSKARSETRMARRYSHMFRRTGFKHGGIIEMAPVHASGSPCSSSGCMNASLFSGCLPEEGAISHVFLTRHRGDLFGLTTMTGLSTSQLISLIVAAGSIIFLIFRLRRPPLIETPVESE